MRCGLSKSDLAPYFICEGGNIVHEPDVLTLQPVVQPSAGQFT